MYTFLTSCALHSVRPGWLLYRPADAAGPHDRNGPVVGRAAERNLFCKGSRGDQGNHEPLILQNEPNQNDADTIETWKIKQRVNHEKAVRNKISSASKTHIMKRIQIV